MTDQQDPRSHWPTREKHLEGGAINLERLPTMDVLRDRYDGAMHETNDDPTALQLRAWRVYDRLLEAVTRRDWRQSGGLGGVGEDIIAELDELVRETILRRVHERGWAAEWVSTVRESDEWLVRMAALRAEQEGGQPTA